MRTKAKTKIKAKKRGGETKKIRKAKKKAKKAKKAEKVKKMKKAKEAKKVKRAGRIPFSRAVIMSVLAFVMALGGYGGYKVVNEYGKYGADFEKRLHNAVEVVDGDTIVIENGVRVRLLGINAPEKAECYGEEAKKELNKLIAGKKIILEKDQTAADNFGRLLRYVFVYNEAPDRDNMFVNEKLLRGGFVTSMYVKPNKRYLALLQAAEREAQKEKAGLWGECDYESAQAGRENEREQASEPFDEKCVIKGNINKRYEKDYFLPGCPNYKRVIIDPRKGERWFCTEKEAKEAGWQISAACGNIHQFEE